MLSVDNNYRVTCCPFCNSASIKLAGTLHYSGTTEFSTHLINLVQRPEVYNCVVCHSAFTQNAIPPRIAEELYESGEGSKRWSPKSFEEDKTMKVQNTLDQYLSQKNFNVLDVGCNTGEFLDFAKRRGSKTFGLEICEESCVIVETKGHVAYRNSKEIEEKFDLITAFDVVEHLYDPNGFFSFVSGMLNEKGVAIVLTGNPESIPSKLSKQNWWYYNYPEHVIFPGPAYFKNLPGFDFISSHNVYAAKSHEEGNLASKIVKAVLSILSGNYNGQPAMFPDHQLVVLQKKVSQKPVN